MQHKGKRILIADDEANLCRVLAAVFRTEGYEVMVGNTGHDALEILRTTPIDLVLLDLIMTDMTGIQFLQTAEELGLYMAGVRREEIDQ
jgi:CheY-like chemotaxis protein